MKTALPKYFALAALSWCCLAPLQALAQDARIAFLSTERIYNESKLAKQASEKLAAQFKTRELAVQDLSQRLKAASDSLEKDLPTLTEAERVKRQREYFELDKEFQRRQREFREDVNQATNEERDAISTKALKIIKQLSVSDGFDIVLYDAVWASPRIDITDKVLKALDSAK